MHTDAKTLVFKTIEA